MDRNRAQSTVFFRAHGIDRVVTVVTDNGANYRAKDFTRVIAATASRHQYIRPYTPRHNGKVERYNRTLAAEVLYARIWTSEAQRAVSRTRAAESLKTPGNGSSCAVAPS